MILSLQKDQYFYKNISSKNEQVLTVILQSTFLFWILTKIICWRLWTIDRLLPTAPPFSFLTAPPAFHLLLFAASLLLMLALLFKPTDKTLLIGLLVAEILACLLDQSRLQPWEYQFIFIVFINIFSHGQSEKILNAYAFVVISTYCYSGIGKFNASFLLLFWDNLLLGQYLKIDPAVIQKPIVHYCGYLVAFAELLFGIGLCFSSTKRTAAWAIIGMHIFILVMVGPFGLRYNSSVWPWNLLMIIHLYFLFIKKNGQPINLRMMWQGWNKLVLLCWGLLPMLNHTVDLWDNFLSSRLFAGNQVMMVLCIKDSSEIRELRPYIESDVHNICDGKRVVNIQKWSMREMNSPAYTELRAYKIIAQRWIDTHPGTTTKAIAYFYITNDQVKIIDSK